VGTAGLAAAAPLLAACGGSASSSSSTVVTFGSNGSDPKAKAAYANVMNAFQKQSGLTVTSNISDQLITLAKKMQADGLTPFMQRFGGGESWMLLGTFDYLNMRTNGYQFHIDLMHGKQSWTDQRLKNVMDNWKRLLPYYQAGAASRKWEDAVSALISKTAGMAVIGMFVGQALTNPDDMADLDFFAFPEIDATHGTGAVEAPMDGYLLSKSPKNLTGANKLMEFLGTAQGEDAYVSIGNSNVAVSTNADTSKYTSLQKKAVDFIAAATDLSQFSDRDSDPGFIQNVVEPAFAQFVQSPTARTRCSARSRSRSPSTSRPPEGTRIHGNHRLAPV
jgi:multiple sugar transport system substrate-binding protein